MFYISDQTFVPKYTFQVELAVLDNDFDFGFWEKLQELINIVLIIIILNNLFIFIFD